MNFYPNDLKRITRIIEALDTVDAEPQGDSEIVLDQNLKLIYASDPSLNYGYLVDEIGGSWSWIPPEEKTA